MDFLDNVYGDAVRVGAVNTVCVRRTADGRFIGLDGYNTDVEEGFRCAFDRYADRWASGSRGALVLGSGGRQKLFASLWMIWDSQRCVSRRPSGEDSIAYGDIDRNLLGRISGDSKMQHLSVCTLT